MNRRLLATAASLALALASSARADLQSDIAAVLGDKSMARVEASVAAARLDAGRGSVVFQHNASSPRIPASNLKVVTSSAALDRFGPDFNYRTCLVRHGNDVLLWGDGDPTFGDSELLAGTNWNTTTVFQSWAEQLKKRGVTSVNDVVVDDSIFDTVFYHPHWPENQYASPYAAEVAGLSLNANCIGVTVRPSSGKASFLLDPPTRYVTVKSSLSNGKSTWVALSRVRDTNNLTLGGTAAGTAKYSVTIHDPALYAAQAFADVLVASGIEVKGQVKRDRTTRYAYSQSKEGFTVVAIHQTPISAVLARSNKDSMNLYAESLCKRLGYVASGGQPGSWTNGPAAVGAFLTSKVGVPASEFHLDDGCGLSKENRVSANTILRVLMYNYNSPQRETFLKSLAVAGEDGTLERRFRNSDLDGRVFAKTGFVEGASALSGYLKTKSGQWYAFSILFNKIPPKSNSGYKVLQEKIVAALDRNAK